MSPDELRKEADRLDELLSKPDVRQAMKHRCEQQGHDWKNCCSLTLRVYQQCAWCEATR
jgi:hypothetical protein